MAEAGPIVELANAKATEMELANAKATEMARQLGVETAVRGSGVVQLIPRLRGTRNRTPVEGLSRCPNSPLRGGFQHCHTRGKVCDKGQACAEGGTR